MKKTENIHILKAAASDSQIDLSSPRMQVRALSRQLFPLRETCGRAALSVCSGSVTPPSSRLHGINDVPLKPVTT